VQSHYAVLLNQARQTQQRVTEAPRQWTALGIVLALLLVLATNARTILHWIREQRLRRHPEEAPQRAAALWYKKMTRLLARKGWKKTPTQTPLEFLTRIQDADLRERVERFTHAYEAARFGDSPVQAGRLPDLYEEINPAVRRQASSSQIAR
jgi:hypothetical protein